jgi:predicted DNA-binding transcriptional regulator AlpA
MAKKTLTTKQLMAGFGVSDMTVFTWRKGTATKEPIPHTVDGRSVTFPVSEVKAWAKKHGVPFDLVKAEGSPDAEKPGPKAAAKKAVPA